MTNLPASANGLLEGFFFSFCKYKNVALGLIRIKFIIFIKLGNCTGSAKIRWGGGVIFSLGVVSLPSVMSLHF